MANRRGWNLKRGVPGRRVLRGEECPWWKGDAATTKTKRDRARDLYSLGTCEKCAAPAKDRHHKDGDTGNNAAENIEGLCRRCHMLTDGRLQAFIASRREQEVLPPQPCRICGRERKPLRKGRCGACGEYLRRNGVERPTDCHGHLTRMSREARNGRG